MFDPEGFPHVHNAVLRKVGSRYDVIARAWNPGDLPVFEQVED